MRDTLTARDFNSLFERYYPSLLFYATQFMDEDEAKDVVQDVFLEVWKRQDSIEMGDKIQAYLYRLVYNRSINVLKHKKVATKYSNAVAEMYNFKINFYADSGNNETIQKLESDELRLEISKAISRLPDKCREVFKLSYIHEMKNKEIADILDISVRTVEAHMYKALRQLRLSLKHLFILGVIFSVFISHQ